MDNQAAAPVVQQAADMNAASFRIATMDCAAEESEIRRALESMAGIQSLRFQLTAQTLAIAATPEIIEKAVVAIRGAGFDPQPIVVPSGSQPASDSHGGMRGGLPRMVLALVLAMAAEAVSYFASAGIATTIAGMAMSAGAIGLSGLSTYRKGLTSLRQARLNINALMSVAVTGAFLIGQWPEAAMVMALYAIAESIEARSVDRARNAIQSLMALTP